MTDFDRIRLSALIVSLSETVEEQDKLIHLQQEVLNADLDIIAAADQELRQADHTIGEQTNALDQIVRAIEDLGLSQVIASRVTFNLTLDLLGFGREMTGAPTVRGGDFCGDFALSG